VGLVLVMLGNVLVFRKPGTSAKTVAGKLA
jgi:hypothetical protein